MLHRLRRLFLLAVRSLAVWAIGPLVLSEEAARRLGTRPGAALRLTVSERTVAVRLGATLPRAAPDPGAAVTALRAALDLDSTLVQSEAPIDSVARAGALRSTMVRVAAALEPVGAGVDTDLMVARSEEFL